MPENTTCDSIYKSPYLQSSFYVHYPQLPKSRLSRRIHTPQPIRPCYPSYIPGITLLALMSLAHPSVQPSSMPPDPLNDDTPTMMHDKPEANSLARAINNLIKSNTLTSRQKLHKPDPF